MDDEELWLEEEEKGFDRLYSKAYKARPKHLQDPWDRAYAGAVFVARSGVRFMAIILYAIWPRK